METHSDNDLSLISVIPSACLSPIFSTSLRLILREVVGLLKWILEGGLLLVLIGGATLFGSPELSYILVCGLVFLIFMAVIIQLLKVKVIS